MKVLMSLGFVLMITLGVHNVKAMSDEDTTVMLNKVITMGLQCFKSYPLTLSEIRAFQNKMMPEGDNPKCFTACMFKKVGVMDDMGMIVPTGGHEYTDQVFAGDEERLKNVDEIMNFCSAVNEESTSDGDKGCDRAKSMFTCLVDNAPRYGFDFDF